MDFKYWKIRIYILSLFAIVFWASCSDSEDPFVGTDNYVTSFTLTKDGVNYTASISGEEIVLSAPENVSLDNATADVKLSERATIYPVPSDIKDWNNEQIFIVTSFNGTDKTYKYKIIREGKVYMGDANLNSQADVDEFAKQGYNIVYGSLNIGEAISDAPITSLEGLRTLRKVTGNLKIGAAYICDNISGLGNITSVGALIVPSQNGHLIDLQLPGLEEIKANATIAGSNIFNVSLPKLKKIGGSLIAQVPTKTFDLSALQEIGCDLSYYVTAESVMKSLVFQSLQSVGGKISATMVLNVKEGSLTTLDMPSLIHCGALEMGKISTLSTLYVPRLAQVD